MLENDFSYSFIDTPHDWHISSEEIDIRGWVVAKADEELSDIRAVLDGVIFYGIMGWDRPDLQAHFDGRMTALRSGFKVCVAPWQGARILTLEALRNGSQWQEFFRTEIQTSGDAMPATQPKPLLRTEVIEESLYHLYRHFHYRSRSEITAEADRVLSEITTAFTPMFPENDLIGFLDLPDQWVNAHYEKFRVSGWTFSKDRQISRMAGSIGTVQENRLIWGKEREDVLHYNPDYPQALKSAFYGLIDVRPESYSPACLKLWVEYPDGPRQLVRSKRLCLNKNDENSGPIPVYREWSFLRCTYAFLRRVIRGEYAVESWKEVWTAVRKTRTSLREKMIRGIKPPSATTLDTPWSRREPFERWRQHNRLTPRLRSFLQEEVRPLEAVGPKFSILVPTYNTPAPFLDELIASVSAQIYPHWELCFADDCSPQKHVVAKLKAAAAADPRIKYTVRETNGHISAATNSALALATGEYVCFLDHDDLLPADALLHVAEAIVAHPDADFLYTDEDKVDASGHHYDPQFKGDWNPEMAITHNYTHHLRTIRRRIVEKVGGLRVGYEGAQDIDLILRCVEHIEHRNILHVPFVCYHWRAHEESTAQRGDQKGYLFDAARRAIVDAVERRGLRAEVFIPPLLQEHALCLHQLKWSPDLLAESPVTIVIPSRNQAKLLSACLDSLDRTVNWAHTQLIIVDDGSDENDALALLARIETREDRPWRVLRPLRRGDEFNYSRLVNLGTQAADTPLVLHLNNDIEALEPGWLEDMVGWLSVSGVGVVGARLIHRDETLNHAGVWIEPEGGLAHCVFVGQPKDEFGFLFLPHAARNTTAVTGACLLTRRDLYHQLNGFDEQDFRVAYNDVDYCLRAAAAGQRTVYTPQSTLVHLGSASRGITYTEKEHLAFVKRYPGFRDPHFSRSLEFANPSFRIDPYDHRFAAREKALSVAVVTHNLNLEGAPLFIFEYARYLASLPGWKVRVFSPEEGALREKFEAAGLDVTVIDASAVRNAPDAKSYRAALKSLAAQPQWRDFDLIVGNTMLTYWLVPLGQQLDIPVELYIHESNTPRRFFSEHNLASPEVIPLIDEAISHASRVVFTAQATWDIFAELNTNDNFRLLNSWVDIERIEAFIASTDKAALRRRYGLDPKATLVVNIGSVCQRKGQHIFVRAIDHLLKTHGDQLTRHGKIEFLMVGAREGLYLESVEQDIELLGIGHCARLYPETLNIYDWYRMADIFVCTSFEESFPRVLLESATFRLPIISTDVNGIPEMLIANDEAHLIKAGDHHVLAATMKTCLDQFFAGDDLMVSRAFTRMSRFYDARVSFATHQQMAREAYFG